MNVPIIVIILVAILVLLLCYKTKEGINFSYSSDSDHPWTEPTFESKPIQGATPLYYGTGSSTPVGYYGRYGYGTEKDAGLQAGPFSFSYKEAEHDNLNCKLRCVVEHRMYSNPLIKRDRLERCTNECNKQMPFYGSSRL